jgi:AraC-like DNA-binding protein
MLFPLHLEIGEERAGCAMHGVLGPDSGAYSITLRGVCYDTALLPPRHAGETRWRVVGLVREGEILVDGTSRGLGPGAVVVGTDRTFVPTPERGVPVRTAGERFHIACLRLHPSLFLDPEPPQPERIERASAALVSAFERLGDRLDGGATPDEIFDEPLADVIVALVNDGIIVKDAIRERSPAKTSDPSTKRTSAAMFSVLFDLAARPMMVDLVGKAAVTERQMLRDIQKLQDDYDLLDRGWRDAVFRWRVTAAAVLLSSKLPISEVARLAGYKSSTAMGRAFRDAGLPSPRDMRKQQRR